MKKYTLGAIIIIIALAFGWYYVSTQSQEQAGTSAQTNTTETGSLADTDIATLSALITGTWRSNDDASAEVVFNEDGTTADVYDGEEIAQGSWELALGAGSEYQDTGVVLTTIVNDQEYRYLVWDLNESDLVLNYVERGNTLSYTRVEAQ